MATTSKQYAVIEARWTERPWERFVISYSDEESLRGLIAGRNILACGFTSLHDAYAHIAASLIVAAPRTQPGSPLAATRDDRRRILFRTGSLAIRSCLTQSWRIVREFSLAALVATILAFYSKNVVSTAMRSLNGSTC
jgi:hypothetical protein